MTLIPANRICDCGGYDVSGLGIGKTLDSRCRCNKTRDSATLSEARERATAGTRSPAPPSPAAFEKIASSCAGKTPYLSKADAIRVLECRRRSKRRPPKGRCCAHPYKCRNCHSWHIGSVAK